MVQTGPKLAILSLVSMLLPRGRTHRHALGDGLRDNAIKSSENGQHKNAQSRPKLQDNNTCTHVKLKKKI